MRLTRTTSHAIRILVDCAEAGGELVKTGEIARRLDITPLNVFKIVHLLSRAGFVEAVRGRNGGVRLSSAADSIRIGDVVRMMEATEVEVESGTKRGAEPKINTIFDEALEAFIGVLDQHTLADMAKRRRPAKAVQPGSAPARRRTKAAGSKATGSKAASAARG